MNIITKILLVTLCFLTSLGCLAKKNEPFKPKVVYQSDDLIITQISASTFEHTSFLQTHDFGNVPCNGLVVTNNNEAIVFDTPTSDKSSEALIGWIKDSLHCAINAVIPTHFHNDCLGGLPAFDKEQVPSYAYFKTIALARENNFAIPKNSFKDSLILKVGKEIVVAKFFGEGHTKDNVVGYFPGEHILFGGCLIKELGANEGYLGDANVAAWSDTVEKVKKGFPDAKIIIPGHGEYGDKKLLDYTINLFKAKQ